LREFLAQLEASAHFTTAAFVVTATRSLANRARTCRGNLSAISAVNADRKMSFQHVRAADDALSVGNVTTPRTLLGLGLIRSDERRFDADTKPNLKPVSEEPNMRSCAPTELRERKHGVSEFKPNAPSANDQTFPSM
jgi:hypothetical protein